MIKIGVGEQHGFDRGLSRFEMRLPSDLHQLRTQIWRGIHQCPPAPVDADRDAALSSRFEKSSACGIALAASTIPLWYSAAGGRS
jgi:hypothetical protein